MLDSTLVKMEKQCNMVMANKSGLMRLNMKGIGKMGCNMDMENKYGWLLIQNIRETGKKV